MKKIIKGLIALGCVIGLLIPSVVSASYMCHPRCCELFDLQKFYTVEYRLGKDWVAESVPAWNADGAAAQLGLKAGYDCFVSFDRVNYDPVLYEFNVSFRNDEGDWVTEQVQAENKNDAADIFGKTVSYDCFVSKVF